MSERVHRSWGEASCAQFALSQRGSGWIFMWISFELGFCLGEFLGVCGLCQLAAEVGISNACLALCVSNSTLTVRHAGCCQPLLQDMMWVLQTAVHAGYPFFLCCQQSLMPVLVRQCVSCASLLLPAVTTAGACWGRQDSSCMLVCFGMVCGYVSCSETRSCSAAAACVCTKHSGDVCVCSMQRVFSSRGPMVWPP